MSLATSNPWLLHAQANQYAVGAFNANSLEQVQAIVSAAQEEKAPVIIQVSRRAAEFAGNGSRLMGLRLMAEMCRVTAEAVSVPVVLHLDHGSEADVLQALACGFTSVMFDGSHLPYEENVASTRRLAAQAHEAGAGFEAELGEVGRVGALGGEDNELTDPDQAADFVARTAIDSLAVSLGSTHAMLTKEAELDLVRLDQIRALVAVPLVLHGSSGVTDTCVLDGIRRGLCKVNVATQLNQAFTRAVGAYLSDHPSVVDPRAYLGAGRQAMRDQVRERMRLFNVSGRAV